ncbi:protein of unknown function (plasmid) [Magnetospirillum sp. XM-1]|uniref:hypothetical protein n=1 Tax=Magnetospirillum sp. XM-1 TaxID=1663591 RepID=UPI00073DD9F6|nr:hypothetical protein [Magnetospirillum sp. XM-1]CUW41936.1 protein of unknown function [Magnetospirillum sp. XM-1]
MDTAQGMIGAKAATARKKPMDSAAYLRHYRRLLEGRAPNRRIACPELLARIREHIESVEPHLKEEDRRFAFSTIAASIVLCWDGPVTLDPPTD